MIDFSFDNKLWTSSYKKLIASTEDDKKLRVIYKILKKALGNQEDKENFINKFDSSFVENAPKIIDATKNGKTPKRKFFSFRKKTVRVETNNNISYEIQTTDLDDDLELHTAHIYETIRPQKAKFMTIEPQTEEVAASKRASMIQDMKLPPIPVGIYENDLIAPCKNNDRCQSCPNDVQNVQDVNCNYITTSDMIRTSKFIRACDKRASIGRNVEDSAHLYDIPDDARDSQIGNNQGAELHDLDDDDKNIQEVPYECNERNEDTTDNVENKTDDDSFGDNNKSNTKSCEFDISQCILRDKKNKVQKIRPSPIDYDNYDMQSIMEPPHKSYFQMRLDEEVEKFKTIINSVGSLNNISDYSTSTPFREKIRKFEELSVKNARPCKAQRRKLFEDEGEALSPIKRNRHRQNRFVVNLYESRTKSPHNQNANIGEEISGANISDKVLKRGIRRNANRVVSASVMDCFGMMEDSRDALHDLEELIKLDETTQSMPPEYCTEEPLYATPHKYKNSQKKTDETKNKEAVENKGFMNLKQKLNIQCKVMREASKALKLCNENKSQDESEIEAEKILLTATCKYEQLMQDMRQNHYEYPKRSSNLGAVTVADIKVPLKQRKDPTWFICVASSEENMYHSDAILISPETDVLEIPDEFTFDKLDSSFQIKIEVFSMKSRRNKSEHKYRFRGSPSTLNKKSRKLLYTDIQTHTMVESDISVSSFTSCGFLQMTVHDLMDNKNTWFIETPADSPITGDLQIDANITKVKIEESQSGFLTVGSDNGYLWNRRWCVLDGTKLKFWNYPNEADDCDPIEVIDLDSSIQEVTNAKRSCCPRPRTLLLETSSRGKYFLNADSTSDMHEWKNKLNNVFMALDGWRMLKHKT